MRHPPMMAPKGRLHIWRKVCQVSESYHISAIAPNSTADAPKMIRPYNAFFIHHPARFYSSRSVLAGSIVATRSAGNVIARLVTTELKFCVCEGSPRYGNRHGQAQCLYRAFCRGSRRSGGRRNGRNWREAWTVQSTRG